MASKKQVEANRRNAQKSTGPKTAAGKATSAANALGHGLSATVAVVPPDEDAFERLKQGTIADLKPTGVLQQALAGRIVLLLWRLERAARRLREMKRVQAPGA